MELEKEEIKKRRGTGGEMGKFYGREGSTKDITWKKKLKADKGKRPPTHKKSNNRESGRVIKVFQKA